MSDDQLIFEIGARTENFATSLLSLGAKASSAMSLIEARGQKSADKLADSFNGVGTASTFANLTKGLSGAEAGAKALGTRLEGIRATLAKTALLQKVQAAGGLSAYASSLADTAGPAIFAGGAAILGFEALKLSLDAIISASKEAEAELARLVKIGTDSRDLGVSTTFLQRFSEGSKKLGLDAAELTSILTKLKDASTVSLGTGDEKNPKSSAQDAIGAEISAGNLSKGDDKAFDAAGTQAERLRAALALLTELQSRGATLAKLDLAGKLFGDDFATKLREDDSILAKLQARVTDIAAGKGANFIPQDQIDRATALDAEIEDLDRRVREALIPFHADVRGWQQDELAATLQLKEYWVEIVETFGRLNQFCDSIGKTISGWGNASLFSQIDNLLDKAGLLDADSATQHTYRDKSGALTTLAKARADGTEPEAPNTMPALLVTKPRGDTSKPLPEVAKAKAAPAEKNDSVDTLIDKLTKATAVEKAEADTQGLSNTKKQEAVNLAKLAAAAKREDRDATADETAQIIRLADASAKAKDQIALFNQKQAEARELASYLGTEFESSVEKLALGGGKLSDIFQSFAASLEKAALQAAILGTGPLAGLLGSAAAPGATGAASVGGLFGGIAKLAGFAEGGQISGEGTGTSDSILGRLSNGEFVINAKATKANLPLLSAINSGSLPKFATGGMVGSTTAPALGGSAGGGNKVTVQMGDVNVNANGGTPAQNADLAKQVSSQMAEIVNKAVVSQIVQQMRPGNILRNAR